MSNPSSPPSSPPQQPPSPPSQELPEIDPTTFDLIIVGTSLPAAILSAAATTAGTTVLHLDPTPYYGGLFTSLPPTRHHHHHPTRRLISAVELPPLPPHLHSLAGKLSLDVSSPRVLFSADAAIDLLMKSGVCDYLEFKAVDENVIFDFDSRRLISVPDSRAAIFKDRSLSLKEKNQLMKLFKLVQLHFSGGGDGGDRISEEDLTRPFFEFLSNLLLPMKIIRIILYAIALADYDQENIEAGNDLLTTKDGIDRLALYHSSTGRFPNAHGAMLYPMYGQGELPQAFCRRAAVKGCIYVLRMPVEAILSDEETGLYRGIKLASGQEVFSQKLIMDPDVVVSQSAASSSPKGSERTVNHSLSNDLEKKVARAICITKTSLKSDASNLLIVLPPRSLYPEQATSVRALQLSSNTAVCPVGTFVVYLSALCNDDDQGKTLLNAAIDTLFRTLKSGSADGDNEESSLENSDSLNAVHEEQRPVCEWKALYVQEITEGSIHTISTTPSPDGKLSYNDLFRSTEEMFQQMFPGAEFFPAAKKEDSEVVDPE
ncbi:hypothetical protein vseg_000704 [Gypsophila vaccaria]